jgi:hypothetical protein
MSSPRLFGDAQTDSVARDRENRLLTSVVDDNFLKVDCLPGALSTFELVLSSNPPILESLLLQIPTKSIFHLYHTSHHLRSFLRTYPTAWKFLSFRLPQPAALANGTGPNGDSHSSSPTRLSSNYGVDQLLIYIVNPFSTNLTSLELDNTSVSGVILLSTVLNKRRETLEHLSVRGCKNVSLKYHVIDWLKGFWAASDPDAPLSGHRHQPQEFNNLALKSLYTYRCRHHRRRPYLPSSLTRRDSDSEPTHELVNLCHKLGIWTDTAWCTSPGARCFRRRGYVTMRVPQDPREVWVVYDRLWRSKNWIGTVDQNAASATERTSIRDGRSWEQDEEASLGEALGTGERDQRYHDGKFLPMHLRKSHREFVEDVQCDSCDAEILERCEQCSVLMHCGGCRKTLCASCAFDRPYTRNRRPLETDDPQTDKFWWAPGCTVSPCLMQDQDDFPIGPGLHPPPTSGSRTPVIKFKWCCIEPVFSGGGGITFGPVIGSREFERVRASPLPRGQGWEDAEFHSHRSPSESLLEAQRRIPDPRTSLNPSDAYLTISTLLEQSWEPSSVPRNLCEDCFESRNWKAQCKGCSLTLCIKHDLCGLRMRVCGMKDLRQEKEDLKTRLNNGARGVEERESNEMPTTTKRNNPASETQMLDEQATVGRSEPTSNVDRRSTPPDREHIRGMRTAILYQPIASRAIVTDNLQRPITPDSNSTPSISRESSPSPSDASDMTPDRAPKAVSNSARSVPPHPRWQGCFSFACPQNRSLADHRRRCTSVMKACQACKVLICETCVDAMEKPCSCKGCRRGDDAEASHQPIDSARFWCPNCRWERERDRKCVRRMELELEKLEKALVRENIISPRQQWACANVLLNGLKAMEGEENARQPRHESSGAGEGGRATTGERLEEEKSEEAGLMEDLLRRIRLLPVVDDVD